MVKKGVKVHGFNSDKSKVIPITDMDSSSTYSLGLASETAVWCSLLI
jgi:hypothetical protein